MLKRRTLKVTGLLFSSFILMVAFQNCMPVQFQMVEEQASLLVKAEGCVFDGKTYQEGEEIEGFENSSVAYDQTCKKETRVCTADGFTGTFQYASCKINEARNCSFGGVDVAHGTEIIAALNPAVPFGQKCDTEMRKCTDGVLSGSFNYQSCQVAEPSSCLFNGVQIAHGGSVPAYQSSTTFFGSSCVSENRTCQNGLLSGTYKYATCMVEAPKSCLFNGQQIPHGGTAIAFQNSNVAYGNACASESRVCDNGILRGTYNFGSCTVGQPSQCLFDGRTIAHGEIVKAYQNSMVAYNQSCAFQDRTCNNGSLTGSYQYSTCQIEKPLACIFDGKTIQHGESVVAYPVSSVPFGNSCVAENRTCTNGSLSGSSQFSSCGVETPKSCLFNGNTIAHGQSVVAFLASNVPVGANCANQTRTCTNGTLSGSYTYSSCVADQDVTPPTVTITSPSAGAYITAANQASFQVTGTCSDNGYGVLVRIVGTALSSNPICMNNQWSTSLDLSSLAQGNQTIGASQTDASNNKSVEATVTVLKDTVGPTAVTGIMDGDYYNSLTTSLPINFNPATDSGSGISHYLADVVHKATGVAVAINLPLVSGGVLSGLTLTDSNLYTVRITAVDKAGNRGTPATSDGWMPDITPPTVPASIDDGDIGTVSSTPLTIWSASSDMGSGVAGYELAVGTSPGLSNLTGWVPVGNMLTYTLAKKSDGSTPTFNTGSFYYTSVRAVDRAGNISAAKSGDGWSVPFTLTITGSLTDCKKRYLKNEFIAKYGSIPSRAISVSVLTNGVLCGFAYDPAIYVNQTPQPTLIINGFYQGSKIYLKNNGYILGAGGNGGDHYATTREGRKGGDAIESWSTDLTIDNTSGYIWGGGGGGGSGGDYSQTSPTYVSSIGGPGGGGAGGGYGGAGVAWGASYDGWTRTPVDGKDGTNGPTGVGGARSAPVGIGTSGNYGGKGGEYGMPGESGLAHSSPYRSGYSGGAAGYSVLINGGSLTWINSTVSKSATRLRGNL